MPMMMKLMVFSVFNMAGLGWLLFALIKSRRTPAEALLIAWRTVLTGCRRPELRGGHLPDGVVLLAKTWWLMLGLTLFCWITQSDPGFHYWGMALILFHLVWFYCSQAGEHHHPDRIIELNSQWGIIFLEVRSDSHLTSKTLSELDLRKKNLLVLAIERQKQTLPFPKGLEVLLPGDRLVMFGDLNYYRGLEP